VFLLMSDSTEAERPGYTTSESVVATRLSKTFHESKGHILVALYASNFIRLQQVFFKVAENGKKVAVVGKSLESYFHVGRKLGYLESEEILVIPSKDIGKYDEGEIIIVVTSNQVETLDTKKKIVRNHHRESKIKQTDTVLIKFTRSSGLAVSMYKIMNQLAKNRARLL